MQVPQFDPNAANVIINLNHRLSRNTGTRLTARMTQKPSILAAYGRYVLTRRPYSSMSSRNATIDSLCNPDSLLIDGYEEVMWGTDSLADFETEIGSYLNNVALPTA